MTLSILPVARQNLQVTRDPIRENFITIDAAFTQDHVSYRAVSGQGKHTAIHLVNQSLAPDAPLTDALECALYAGLAKNATGVVQPNTSTLYVKGQSSAITLDGFDILAKDTSVNGWTALPSGMYEQWGIMALSDADAQGTLITFPRAFPTAVRSIQLQEYINGNGDIQNFLLVRSDTITLTNFRVKAYTRSGNRSNVNIYFYAVGY